MNISELKNRPEIVRGSKLDMRYTQFQMLLAELRGKSLSGEVVAIINRSIEEINHSSATGNKLFHLIKQKQSTIIKQVEKTHKIVPRNYYRNLWMLLGFTSFGLPIGTAFGLLMHNIGLLSVGLPIGMAIGAGVGSSMDKKAAAEGRQLDLEMKY